MTSQRARSVLLGVTLVALSTIYSGCKQTPEAAAPAVSSGSSGVTLDGLGSTFIAPIMAKWANEYHNAHPDVTITYRAVGSSAGILAAVKSAGDFEASDGPMTDEMLKEAGQTIFHFPAVLGADVPTYNIPGVSEDLNFTRKRCREFIWATPSDGTILF